MAGRSKRVRVRSKRLEHLDETKLSLALWLLTRELLTDTETPAQPAPPPDETTLDDERSEAA